MRKKLIKCEESYESSKILLQSQTRLETMHEEFTRKAQEGDVMACTCLLQQGKI
jgi:hypothetical protein